MQNRSEIFDSSHAAAPAGDAPWASLPGADASLPARIRQTTVAGVCAIVEKGVGRVGEDLAELAVRTFQYDRQRALGAGASLLSEHGKGLPARFAQAYAQAYDRSLAGEGVLQAPARPSSVDELSLVGDEDMSDQVQISRLVHRTRGAVDADELLGARARFGAMLGRDWFDDGDHPLAPEVIYGALNAVLDACTDRDDGRLAVLEGFERYLSANLGGVYVEINRILRENGVLPKIKRRVALTGQGAPRRGAAPAGPAESAAAGEPDEDVAPAETFELPPPGPDRDAVLAILARRVAEGTIDARRSAVRMLRSQSDLIGQGESLAVDESLIEVLSHLQARAASEEAGPISGAQLKSLALGEGRNGAALDQLTVEIVSLIFDYLYHDPRLPDSVKQQLLRLQVVAVKAALLDRSFFASKTHPMRRLIDRATEIGCDPDTDAQAGSQFVLGLGGIVDDVLSGFERDLSVFDEAGERLAALEQAEVERREARLRDFTAEAEQAEAGRLAHDEASRGLGAMINDLTPSFLREFLLERWVRVVAAARLQGPPGEAAREAAMRQADTLLWSVEPKKAAEIPEMAAQLPSLVRELMTGMDRVGEPREQLDAFFDELMRWHTRLITQAKSERRSGQGPDTSVRSRLQDRAVPPPPPPAPARDEHELLAALQRGQLVEVRQKNKAPLRVKIAWISPGRSLFALSRFPDFARSLSREQMLASLQSGRLAVVTAEGTVERAIRAVESTGESFPQTTIIADYDTATLMAETGIQVPV